MVELYEPNTRRTNTPPLRPAVPHLSLPREIPTRQLLTALAIIASVALVWYLSLIAVCTSPATGVIREAGIISGEWLIVTR